jgi:hypothetical protein
VAVDGAVYTGDFQYGREQGTGTLVDANGDKYVGEFLVGKAHGKGRRTYSNGSIYKGQFRFGVENGEGTLIMPWGATVHDAQWIRAKSANVLIAGSTEHPTVHSGALPLQMPKPQALPQPQQNNDDDHNKAAAKLKKSTAKTNVGPVTKTKNRDIEKKLKKAAAKRYADTKTTETQKKQKDSKMRNKKAAKPTRRGHP